MSIIPKIDDYHKALWLPQVTIVMTTCSAPGDDEGGVMTTLGFQYNDTSNTYLTNVHWYLGTIYDNLFSDIFHHHSEPFVKMWNESIFHSCQQTKLNNILVNDGNILPSFRRISYFHPEVSFKATKSIDRLGTHVVSVYATGFLSRDNNVRDEM